MLEFSEGQQVVLLEILIAREEKFEQVVLEQHLRVESPEVQCPICPGGGEWGTLIHAFGKLGRMS